MTHQLLPQPKNLIPHKGNFALDRDTLIIIPAVTGEDAFLAARQIQDEVCETSNIRVPIVKAFKPPRSESTILLTCGPEQAAAFGTAEAWSPHPHTPKPAPSKTRDERISAQSYALSITPSRAILHAETPAGLFYAAQTLRQLVRLNGHALPALTIQDWPALPYRGLMLDISRGKVPTLTTLKRLIGDLSHHKLNVLQLYTEHTFRFQCDPQIGARSGSLSSQDIVELDSYCRQHHVELMPNLQSFGHGRKTLTLPEYQHLAETDLRWTLSPAFEETYDLLDRLYAEVLAPFTSTTFNVGCDETWDLGQGASKDLADEVGVGRLYLSHMRRVRELAARYGRRIQFWGDIVLHHPELLGEIPDDVILLDWHYDPADEYPTVEAFARSGRQFWVCPGVGSWNSIFPRLHGANLNIRNFVRDGVAAGAEGMLLTDWGDHGHYQPLGLSAYGYAFGADQSWTGGTTPDDTFEAGFGPLFFGPQHGRILGALHQLARTNELPNVYRRNRSHTILALFDDPLAGATVEGEDALPAETLREMRALAETAESTLEELAPGHPRSLTLREMAFAARLTGYTARKTSLSQEIRRALRDPHLDAERICGFIQELKTLDAELECLRAEFEALWLARARRSEIHVALGHYAGLRARYRAAIDWLERQRQELLKGQPVDAELATYDASDYRTLWQNWPD